MSNSDIKAKKTDIEKKLNCPKYLRTKIFLRLPVSLISALHARAKRADCFAYHVLQMAVAAVVSELLAETLLLDKAMQRRDIICLVDLLLNSKTSAAPDFVASASKKINPMFNSAKRKGLMLEVSSLVVEQLVVLERTSELSRQKIVEACLIYYLRPVGVARPKRSVLKKFLCPVINLNLNLNSYALRDLMENQLT